MPRATDALGGLDEPTSEVDLRAIGAALNRRRRTIILPTLLAFFGIGIYVNVVPPRYTAQSQILLENQETFFTRPDRVNLPAETASQLDEAAVASQVQLIESPDVARRAIRELKLAGNPEFDPAAKGVNPLSHLLVLLGLLPDPERDSAETRITDKFLQKLTVFSPPKTRVITVEFTSRDAALSARAANTVAQIYIEQQSAAKRAMAQAAAEALSAQISDLRGKLAKADAEREKYRSQSGLLAGNNNMTISGQQLADLNGDLSRARAIQADAQAKATMIRELLRSGKAADVTEVTNSDLVRRAWEQRTTAQAQLALESRTLLPEHPRIKELTAQVAQYDAALKNAARQAATTLENEASVAGQRVANLETALNQQKQAVGVANTDQIHLAALDRIAQSYKDQLESSSTKYEEALARQSSTATPADARVISRAARPELPSFPKKLPFVLFGTLATLVFSVGYIIAAEILSGDGLVRTGPTTTPDRRQGRFSTGDLPVRPAAAAPTPGLQRPRVSDMPSARHADAEPARAARRGLASDALVFAPVPSSAGTSRRKAEPSAASHKGFVARVAAAFARFSQSAAASAATPSTVPEPKAGPGVGWEPVRAKVVPPQSPATSSEQEMADRIAALADRIVEKHVPGRGLHVVGTGADSEATASDRLIALSRQLAHKGRSILLDLGESPTKLAALSDIENGREKIMQMQGLSELLSGSAGFAEVIHRDCASRLHYIPTGLREADFRDFDLILDALSETYDFVVLLAPPYPQSEIAKVMAPYADFMVLAASSDPEGTLLDEIGKEMVDAGARDILMVDAKLRPAAAALNVA